MLSSDAGGELAVEEESLQILEWPAVCRQVACFCRTSMAAERVAGGLLPLGATRAESEGLLQLTAEAVAADLPLEGVCACDCVVGGRGRSVLECNLT
jgi:hypothetical protein